MAIPSTSFNPNDINSVVATLFERLGNLMEKVDNLGIKLDQQEAKRIAANDELETRVEHIEAQITSARWFITGLAAGGGVIGGTVASLITRLLGN